MSSLPTHFARYVFVVPTDRLKIGRTAREVYQRRNQSVRAVLRSPNLALLGRILDAARNPMLASSTATCSWGGSSWTS